MRKVSRFLGVLLLGLTGMVSVFAQAPTISREVIAAGGDFFVSPIGSLSWTLGEPVVETVVNGSISIVLTQGFQQPDERDSITIGIFAPAVSGSVALSLYPNPASHHIYLDLRYNQSATLRIELLDMLGRVLNSDELEVYHEQVHQYTMDIHALPSAMYILRITEKGKLLNSYKFQKVTH
ncbi:MAG: hypothetical protein KatS3mg031_0632 [Chitinophagales bacterium]|nr:MAG: hypothetical protein KatS3mg031_0632 [Chitinophagales bacterium]